MSLFTFDDTVRVRKTAPLVARRGALASVIMLFEENERKGAHFDQFPPGVVYSVEFEDGDAEDVHESHLELVFKSERNQGKRQR